MHVTFLVWGKKGYDPGVRVSIDLAESIGPLGVMASAVVVEGSPETLRECRERLGEDAVLDSPAIPKLVEVVRALNPDVVFSKDHIHSLEALSSVKHAIRGIKTMAITSGFYGLELLQPPPESEAARGRASPGLRRFLPFTQATAHYRKLLRDLDGIVTNSYYSEMLLELLYGFRPLGVVYPVVDPKVYHLSPDGRPRRGILVFVGPAGNRTPAEYLPTLRDLPSMAGPLHLFGSPDATGPLHQALGVARSIRHVDLPVEKLVELYQSVRVTYITSEWEGFGYVGPESLLCQTPVVTEVAQPWMEITGESEASFVAREENELLERLVNPPSPENPTVKEAAMRLAHVLSPGSSGTKLLRALQRLD